MKARKTLRTVAWVSVAIVLGTTTAWSLRAAPVPETTARVTRAELSATVKGEGKTRVHDVYVVAAPVDGELQRIAVQAGDAVAADALVATMKPAASRPLDPRSRAEASAAVAMAQAAVARAEADEQEARVALEHAESQLDTSRKLVASGSVAADEATHRGHEAEMRRSAVDAAVAAVAQARAELARALSAAAEAPRDAARASTPVRSPVAGRLLRLLRESAGPVSAGTPLVEIGDVTRLEVDADLLSSDAAEVREGAAATVTGWGGSQPLDARVRRIDPAAFTKVSALGLEEQRVHVILDLTAPPPAGLGHDYRVDVAVVVWDGKDVLRVPSSALFRVGDRWAVFRMVDGRSRRVLVQTGPTDGTWTVVTSGLGEGDEVITQPSDDLDEGTRVRPR